MYVEDLANATEVVLDERSRVRAPGTPALRRPPGTRARGSAGRAVAGAMRIGSAVSAAVTNRRVLEPIEAHIALSAGAVLLILAVVAVFYPRILAFPLAGVAAWLAATLFARGLTLLRERHRRRLERPIVPRRANPPPNP